MKGCAHSVMRPAGLLATAAALMAFAAPLVRAQAGSDHPELAAGKILVASRKLADPNFAETVILLVQYEEKGTVGLILNRQSKIPVSRLSREMEVAKGRSDPLYAGGPVERTGMLALFRSRTKPEDARHVFADVYMISSKATLEKTIASTTATNVFRLYLGYAGWAEGQLEFEIEMGAWQVLSADSGIVFDAHPETLWPRLVEQEGLQIASLRNR